MARINERERSCVLAVSLICCDLLVDQSHASESVWMIGMQISMKLDEKERILL